MIYGNKLLNTDNLAIVTLEQDINNINKSLDIFNDNNILTEASITNIISIVFQKIKEALIKILDTVSKLFKKVLPFIYNAIQKLIIKIKNSMTKSKFDQTKFSGKKEFSYYILNDKIRDIIADAKTAQFDKEIKSITQIQEKYLSVFNKDKKQIKQAIKELNPEITKFNESIKKKLEPFQDILSLETFKEFYDTKNVSVESANDYDILRKTLESVIDNNTLMSNDMKEVGNQISSSITNLQLEHLGNRIGVGVVMKDDDIIKQINYKDLSKIPKIYGKIVDVYMGAIKSEIKVVNEISKYGRYDVTIDNGEELVTKFV